MLACVSPQELPYVELCAVVAARFSYTTLLLMCPQNVARTVAKLLPAPSAEKAPPSALDASPAGGLEGSGAQQEQGQYRRSRERKDGRVGASGGAGDNAVAPNNPALDRMSVLASTLVLCLGYT